MIYKTVTAWFLFFALKQKPCFQLLKTLIKGSKKRNDTIKQILISSFENQKRSNFFLLRLKIKANRGYMVLKTTKI